MPEFDQTPFPVACDCSELTLRMAIHELGAARCFTLAVSPREYLHAWNHVRIWTDAPLAQQINVVEDKDLDPFAWYLTANGRSVGSRGV